MNIQLLNGAACGPGLFYHLTSALPFPQTPTALWIVRLLYTPAPVNIIYEERYPVTQSGGQRLDRQLMAPTASFRSGGGAAIKEGDPVTFHAHIQGGTAADQAEIAATWWPVMGLGSLLAEFFVPSGGGGGTDVTQFVSHTYQNQP